MADFIPAFDYAMTNEEYPPSDSRYGKVEIDNDGGMVRFGLNSKGLGASLVNTTFYTTMSVDIAFKTAQFTYNNTVWKELCGGAINSQMIASKMFDMGVNEGVEEASKLAQRAAGVDVDGIIGPITYTEINNLDPNVMMGNLIQWWKWFINQVILAHPQYEEDRDAWTARAEKLPPAA